MCGPVREIVENREMCIMGWMGDGITMAMSHGFFSREYSTGRHPTLQRRSRAHPYGVIGRARVRHDHPQRLGPHIIRIRNPTTEFIVAYPKRRLFLLSPFLDGLQDVVFGVANLKTGVLCEGVGSGVDFGDGPTELHIPLGRCI